ncbi:MAG: metalloregulator ArsR/SmtB family transcription factor [Halovenus sp.]
MDSAELLDLLGNANRRRILQLLAQKPCYVTEISEFLGVSPKAVIDHLRKLEDAGVVESRTDDRRRKYFSISRHVRLEVTVSPYKFGTKSAYPASSGLDITSCRRLTIELDQLTGTDSGTESDSVGELTEQLHDLEQLENELSLAQRWVQGRLVKLREQLAAHTETDDPRLVADLLVAVADGTNTVPGLSEAIGAPPRVVEGVLMDLADAGVVAHEQGEWRLVE